MSLSAVVPPSGNKKCDEEEEEEEERHLASLLNGCDMVVCNSFDICMFNLSRTAH